MNEPQLSAEIRERFELARRRLSPIVDLDHKPVIEYTAVKCSAALAELDDLEKLLATALEEQRKQVLEEVDEAITKRVLPAPLYGNYKEDRLHQRWQAELNQLKGEGK